MMRQWLAKHYFVLIVVIVALVLALTSGYMKQLTGKDYLDFSYMTHAADKATLLSTAVTAVATVAAISFSISILAIQHASSNYTPSILAYYREDARTWFVFLFYVSTIIIGSLSLAGNELFSIDLNLTLLFASFLFLISQFVHTMQLVDPRTLIRKVEHDTVEYIKKIPHKLLSDIKKAQPRTDFEKNLFRSRLFYFFRLHRDEKLLKHVKNGVLQITDIMQKAASRAEYETTQEGLQAFVYIADSYVEIRKDDLTPDDQFLDFLMQRLVASARTGFVNDDEFLLRETITSLEKIGLATTEIVSLAPFTSNMATKLAGHHIQTIGLRAISRSLSDTTAQAVESLANLGVSSLVRTGEDSLTVDKIIAIGTTAIGVRNWYVTGHSITALNRLSVTSIKKLASAYGVTNQAIEGIQKLLSNYIKTGMSTTAIMGFFMPISDASIHKIAEAALTVKRGDFQKIETHPREEYAKEVISRLVEALEEVGREAVAVDNNLVVIYIANTLRDIGILCTKEKFTTFQDRFSEELEEILTTLTGLLSYRENIMPSINSEIPLAVARLAMESIDEGLEKVADTAIADIHDMAVRIIPKDKFGYDPPRIAKLIAVIGVYAIKMGLNALKESAVSQLIDFDRRYLKDSKKAKDQLHIKELENDMKIPKYRMASIDQEQGLIAKLDEKSFSEFSKIYRQNRNKIESPK